MGRQMNEVGARTNQLAETFKNNEREGAIRMHVPAVRLEYIGYELFAHILKLDR